QLAVDAGKTRERRVGFDLRDRQPPVPFVGGVGGRVGMDLPGPAGAVAPALAVVGGGGEDAGGWHAGQCSGRVVVPASKAPLTPALSPLAGRGGMCVALRATAGMVAPLTPALSPQAGRGGMCVALRATAVRLRATCPWRAALTARPPPRCGRGSSRSWTGRCP